MTFSNRILAILVLVGTLGFFYLIYIYFFVYYTSVLNISSNVDAYKVELFATKIAQTFERDCPTATCSLADISPFDYNVTITKEGYEPYSTSLDLKGATTIDLNIKLKKRVELVKVEEPLLEESLNKIDILKVKNTSYLSFDMGKEGVFYFDENDEKLVLYTFKENQPFRIGDFTKVPKEKLMFTRVYGEQNTFLISAQSENFLYFQGENSLIELNLRIPVQYAKKGTEDQVYFLVTDKWTFEFDRFTWNERYITLFHDFIELDGELYVWYIDAKDTLRKTNMGYIEEYGDIPILVKYFQESLEREVSIALPLSVKKMYVQENRVLIETEEGTYEIKWLQ